MGEGVPTDGADRRDERTAVADDETASRTVSRDWFIREAMPRDLTAMFDIRGLVDENRMTRSELVAVGLTEEVIRARLNGPLAAWVAEFGGQVVGYSMADRVRGCVWALFVLPSYQRRGIGGALLERASVFLIDSGFARLILGTDPSTRAYRFYLRHGWTDAGERHRPAGSPMKPERRLELDVQAWATRRVAEAKWSARTEAGPG